MRRIYDAALMQAFVKKAISWKRKRACLFWPYSKYSDGYARMCSIRVSRIVCIAVHGKPPKGKLFALHTCNNGHLGCINPHHLYWGNAYDNAQDAIMFGTRAKGETHGNSKLTEDDVRNIRQKYADGYTYNSLAEEYQVQEAAISKIVLRRAWKHLQ